MKKWIDAAEAHIKATYGAGAEGVPPISSHYINTNGGGPAWNDLQMPYGDGPVGFATTLHNGDGIHDGTIIDDGQNMDPTSAGAAMNAYARAASVNTDPAMDSASGLEETWAALADLENTYNALVAERTDAGELPANGNENAGAVFNDNDQHAYDVAALAGPSATAWAIGNVNDPAVPDQKMRAECEVDCDMDTAMDYGFNPEEVPISMADVEKAYETAVIEMTAAGLIPAIGNENNEPVSNDNLGEYDAAALAGPAAISSWPNGNENDTAFVDQNV